MGQSKFYLSFVIHSRPSSTDHPGSKKDVRKIVELQDLRGSLRT